MGLLDWLRGGRPAAARPATRQEGPVRPRFRVEVVHTTTQHEPIKPEDRWYVPAGSERDRFQGDPVPLHLIEYHGGLTLCDDATGRLVGSTDRRLRWAGIYSFNLRGLNHRQAAYRAGDFRPGQRVRLVREPDNAHDPNAVAVTADQDGALVVGYVSRGHARWFAKIVDAGTHLEAICTRGDGSGESSGGMAILAADPAVLAHLLSPRPADLPTPAHLR